MYKQKRLELSKKYKMTRISRMKLRDYRGHEGEAKYLVGKYTDITSPRVVQERRNIIETFPNAVIDVNKYNGIDQGQNGACSMVAIFNAFELHGHTKHFLKLPYYKVKRSWRKYWKPPMQIGTLDASSDLGEALDMISKPLIKSHDGLIYMPLRSEDKREQCFNEEFWKNDKNMMIQRYNIPHPGEYEKMKHIYEIAYYIENQIDQGIPVVINVNEHCRVAVGYNQTKLLFADSWGRKYTQSNKSGSSVNIAGFSVDCKWMVYCWARDLVTFAFGNGGSTSCNDGSGGGGGSSSSRSSSSITSSSRRKTAMKTGSMMLDGGVATTTNNNYELKKDGGSKGKMQRIKRKKKKKKRDTKTDTDGAGSKRKKQFGETSNNNESEVVIDLTFDDSDDELLSLSLTERLRKKRKKS